MFLLMGMCKLAQPNLQRPSSRGSPEVGPPPLPEVILQAYFAKTQSFEDAQSRHLSLISPKQQEPSSPTGLQSSSLPQ